MKQKTMILMGVAIVCGLVASYMTSRLLADRGKEQPEQDEKVNVLVAKQNIPFGTLIDSPDKFFQMKGFTPGEEPKNALKSFDDVAGKRINRPLGVDNHVTKDDLMDKEREGLASKMPKGTRAFALPVNAVTTGGGFVLPNTRVDVICVIRGQTSIAKTIMQDMLVLAVDTADTRDDRKAMISNTVTLQATPEQCEKLTAALAMGELRLSLRPFDDKDRVGTRGFDTANLVRGGSGGAADTNPDGDSTNTQVAGSVGLKFPKEEAKKPEQPATPAPTVVVQNDPPPPPPKTRKVTQLLHNGPLEPPIKVVFEFDLETGELLNPLVERSEPEQPAAAQPATPPAPPRVTPQPVPKENVETSTSEGVKQPATNKRANSRGKS